MSYFGAGLWHFAAALAFGAGVGVIAGGDPLHWLRQPLFTLFLMVSSSAFFFVPDFLAKHGAMKFLHYPLPDWDVLLLAYLAWREPQFYAHYLALTPVAVGLCVGISSHLFWDCVGSRSHKIIVVPHWFALREATSRFYLLLGAAISLLAALRLAGVGRNLGF